MSNVRVSMFRDSIKKYTFWLINHVNVGRKFIDQKRSAGVIDFRMLMAFVTVGISMEGGF